MDSSPENEPPSPRPSTSTQLDTTINPETIELLKKDELAERRLLFFAQKKFVLVLDEILNNKVEYDFYSIYVDLKELNEFNEELYTSLFRNPAEQFQFWKNAAQAALQIHLKARDDMLEPGASVKVNVTVRFFNNPVTEKKFPTYRKRGKLMQVRGRVRGMCPKRLVEYQREIICQNENCGEVYVGSSTYHSHYNFEYPDECEKCTDELDARDQDDVEDIARYFHEIQEIEIEDYEDHHNFKMNLKVTLDDDIAETIRLGEKVFVFGTLERRHKPTNEGKEALVEYVFKANSATPMQRRINYNLTDEDQFMVEEDWYNLLHTKGEFAARDVLVESFEPNVYAMALTKLLILTSLASCVITDEKYRQQSHIMLIGHSGCAKSNLLMKASKMLPDSFFGGCASVSTAGLTVGLTQEDGFKSYELGILPSCDGGVCCLDEFNNMSEMDKGACHEAMEQQTIHVSKFGLHIKVRTRCVIMAACNPDKYKIFRRNNLDIPIEFKISGALMSRFDAIFVIRDFNNDEHHRPIADRITKDILTPGHYTPPYSEDQLRRHLLNATKLRPTVREGAETILHCYYVHLERDPEVDPIRKTRRCLQSLTRLAKAYARLLLKTEVTELDAVVVLCLIMENSYSNNRDFDHRNPLEKKLPLGPTQNECKEILMKIRLPNFIPEVLKQWEVANKPQTTTTQFRAGTQATRTNSNENTKEPEFRMPTQRNPRPCSSKSTVDSEKQTKEAIKKKMDEEIKNEKIRLSQKFNSAISTYTQNIQLPVSDDGIDFLDQLEMMHNSDDCNEVLEPPPLNITEPEKMEESVSPPYSPLSSPLPVVEEISPAAISDPGPSFKDVLKQFSFSQFKNKREIPSPVDESMDVSSPKKPKPVEKSTENDLNDIKFENILESVRDSFSGTPSDPSKKKETENMDFSELDIDESIFDDDF
ncbi:DNA helicase MCM9-like [Culicoides brevitarsis]|uniref:DNA helicase MCM9-like n=1 Tax=Culicoides brevitarsis TaxID=469753 RepID=UPI00307BA25B